MLTRIISGVAGAILVISMLLYNSSLPIMLNILVIIASVFSVGEILSATGIVKQLRIFIPSMIFAIIFPLHLNGLYNQTTWYIYTLIIFGIMVLFNGEITVKDITISYGVTILIVFSLTFLLILRDFGGKDLGGFYALIALGTAWLTDTGAYFFGIFFGKHKLCEKISPKKTIEGVIGGTIFCILTLNLMVAFFQVFIFQNKICVNYLLITFIAAVGSIISMIGDLSFSIIKRGYHIKDFGNVIPGHGGMLDRFDSVIFTVPFVYLTLKALPVIILC